MRREIWGWGRSPRAICKVEEPRDRAELTGLVGTGPVIARGAGRAYGDAALQPQMTISTLKMNRFISFDEETGVLVAESGVMLAEILRVFVPRGWFPPVTPGCKFVTLGGMIAADVHGKNHHNAGSFGNHIDWIEVMGADGKVRKAKPGSTLFAATIGGMGLTGVILRASVRMRKIETGWIRQESIVARNLDEVMDALEDSESWDYSVAWIDCLATGSGFGRSIVYLGEHATPDELGDMEERNPFPKARKMRTIPIDAPGWLLNRYTARLFNALYYRAGVRNEGERLIDWDTYFYPLDAVGGWNRLYGRRGFSQYQCVFPLEASKAGLKQVIGEIARSGQGAFLGVLKRFGPGTGTGISFPMEGYTLALDFPMSPGSLDLMDDLDRIVQDLGGRLYLAKDSRMRPAMMRAGYADTLEKFTAACDRQFMSLQSERLDL
ncbi:FAD-binding oxidoreductase [Rhodobacteraceae bacterium NNCM2]|nr:FAD-binding oxidoreductase [Coraliihabitans acroporae]